MVDVHLLESYGTPLEDELLEPARAWPAAGMREEGDQTISENVRIVNCIVFGVFRPPKPADRGYVFQIKSGFQNTPRLGA